MAIAKTSVIRDSERIVVVLRCSNGQVIAIELPAQDASNDGLIRVACGIAATLGLLPREEGAEDSQPDPIENSEEPPPSCVQVVAVQLDERLHSHDLDLQHVNDRDFAIEEDVRMTFGMAPPRRRTP